MTTTFTLPDTSALFIGGKWCPAAGAERIAVRNPATEQVIADVPAGTPDDVDAACRAAADALPVWSAVPPAERAAACRAISAGLEARAEDLADLITADLGMPRAFSRSVQVGLAVTDFANLADAADQHVYEREAGNSIVREVPVGVVGAITPWNFPLHQVAAKVGGALAAGAPVVLKPSQVTPLGVFVLADVIAGLDLPPGVFNLVSGAGAAVGEALVRHPAVDFVSFTGSTGAGSRVATLAAGRVRPTALELGGKSPAVLLDDLDDTAFEKALRRVMAGSLLNSGQMCSALTRIIVPEHRLDAAEQILAAAAGRFRVGDPFDPDVRLGPVVSAAQRTSVRGHIERAIAEGAHVVTGGPDAPDGLDTGYFVRPTVFSRVERDSAIVREEVFGPVLVLQTHRGTDDAVAVANDTEYGLAAGVFGADAEAVAWRIRAGQVEVNGAGFNPAAPFGGFGDSGYGREFGGWGIDDFLTTQAVQR
ncbi:aldehyde dehydrogenase family protein [Amycolatopsis nalaikhensis]|uniref:aldehyde dehydrogenase (NAD(+)) n=1 Tax=Amycolatopsis nalaikhensis TaxID=715472 RepID=A0ABY8X961_9PSEU|nr:aldehyde dehydrogenase family protein [Amycolatopsis sp. 2-2]WIV52918.1 aldehyde dehydrogenase family protein [Amycolatopsis sp. 2-2]